MHGGNVVVEVSRRMLSGSGELWEAQCSKKARGVQEAERRDQTSIVILVRVVEWRDDEFWWKGRSKACREDLNEFFKGAGCQVGCRRWRRGGFVRRGHQKVPIISRCGGKRCRAEQA